MKNFTEYPKLRRGNMDYTKGPLITYTSLEPARGGGRGEDESVRIYMGRREGYSPVRTRYIRTNYFY